MNFFRSFSAALVALACSGGSPVAQEGAPIDDRVPEGFRALLRDGRIERLQPEDLDAERFRFRLADGAGQEAVAGALLALHGRAPRPRGAHVVTLVGGEVLRGEIRGGDELGDSFTLHSAVLGDVVVPIDRLALLRFVDGRAGIADAQLAVPDGADEVLFVATPRGVDRISGEIHRFTRRAIRFLAEGQEDPTGWLFSELVALAIAGGFGREEPPAAWLTTTAGDRIGIDEVRISAGGLLFRDESGQERRVPLGAVSAVSLAGDGDQWLSGLPFEVVEQRSFFGDRPLFRTRVDRSVDGSLLAVAGLGGGTGLGMHSRTRLRVRVPDGVRALVGGVGIDDSVESLRVRPVASVAIRSAGQSLFELSELRPGPLRPLGRIPVSPGQELILEVDFGAGLDLGDRVDWIDCVFVQ